MRGPQVRQLPAQAAIAGGLRWCAAQRIDLGRCLQCPGGHDRTGVLGLPRHVPLTVAGERSHRLQHAVAGLPVELGVHEGRVHQGRELDGAPHRQPDGIGDGLHTGEVDPVRELGQVAQQQALGLLQQLVGPVEGRAEGALAPVAARWCAEEVEGGVEPTGQVLQRQRRQASGGQLDREGQAVEALHDVADDGVVVVAEREVRPRAARRGRGRAARRRRRPGAGAPARRTRRAARTGPVRSGAASRRGHVANSSVSRSRTAPSTCSQLSSTSRCWSRPSRSTAAASGV